MFVEKYHEKKFLKPPLLAGFEVFCASSTSIKNRGSEPNLPGKRDMAAHHMILIIIWGMGPIHEVKNNTRHETITWCAKYKGCKLILRSKEDCGPWAQSAKRWGFSASDQPMLLDGNLGFLGFKMNLVQD